MGSIVLHFTLVITCFQFDHFFCIISKISDYYKHLSCSNHAFYSYPLKILILYINF